MGSGRKFRKAPVTRPKKKLGDKSRRQREQKKRLIGLGMDEAVVGKMNAKQIRDHLKRPAKVVAQNA